MTSRRHMDRRALFASGAAAAILAATGVSSQPVPARGGRLRAALSGADRSDRFDSRQDHGLFMQVAMVGAVFDTLTEIAADGTLRGELATVWRGTPDATVWTIELRRGVDFHNGAELTANDVLASFALHRGTLLRDVAKTSAPTTHSLRIELKSGDPDFPYRLSDPRLIIYPGTDLSVAMYEGIGTGLYRVHRFQPGRHMLAHRVDQHYKDGLSGWFDEIELVGLSADEVRAEALREHYVDVADLTHTGDLGDLTRLTMLPEENFMTAVVDDCVAFPTQTGSKWPFDNFRAAERWWMA